MLNFPDTVCVDFLGFDSKIWTMPSASIVSDYLNLPKDIFF